MKVARIARALRAPRQLASARLLEAIVRRNARQAPSLDRPPSEPRSIFVLRNNDVGDLLVVTPLFAALRQLYPAALLAAGVGDWNRDVLMHNPYLSEVLPVNAPWFNKYLAAAGALDRLEYLRSSEVRELARRNFEIGIDVLGSAWGALLLLRAGIPYRLGVRGFAGGDSAMQATVTFDPAEHVGRSALRFAELLGASEVTGSRPQIFLSVEEREWAERWWAAGPDCSGRGWRVVLAPGGGLAAKCWPVSSFVALAGGLAQLDQVRLLALGGRRELDLVEAVVDAAPRARSLQPAPGLRQTFALIATSDLVVCNSSMPMHVAAAFERPTMVLLGESFPSASQHQAQWGYPGICISLGKEPGSRASLATPAEVLRLVRDRQSLEVGPRNGT